MKYILLFLTVLVLGCTPTKPADVSISLRLSSGGELELDSKTIEIAELVSKVSHIQSEGKVVDIVISSSHAQKEVLQSKVKTIQSVPRLTGVTVITIVKS